MRFASVYRQFEDVEAFHEEIQRLRSARASLPAPARGGPSRAHKHSGRSANRDQLPLLPADPAANDGDTSAGGKK